MMSYYDDNEKDTNQTNPSIFLIGRYLKVSREISQTPFVDKKGNSLSKTDVETEIKKIFLKFLPNENFKFIPAGREDMDVRMIGRGRPFCFEIIKPTFEKLSNEILNDIKREFEKEKFTDVQVKNLEISCKESILKIKKGEEEKDKCYHALVWIPRKVTENDYVILNNQKDLYIDQLTPIRVLHRRANHNRIKRIINIKAEKIKSHSNYLTLNIKAQAGTYIKEFINGNYGRSNPSIKSLLNVEHAVCFQLDVLDIIYDFE